MEILNVVSYVTGVPMGEITGTSQEGKVAQARHLVCYFEHQRNKKKSDEISFIVNRDRSTVSSSIRVITYRLASRDKEVLRLVDEIGVALME